MCAYLKGYGRMNPKVFFIFARNVT